MEEALRAEIEALRAQNEQIQRAIEEQRAWLAAAQQAATRQQALPSPPQDPIIWEEPKTAPRLKSMAQLFKEEYGYDYVPPTDEERMRRNGSPYQANFHCHPAPLCSHPYARACVPPHPPQQYQAQRETPPPPPQVHQNPAVSALSKQINEQLDMVVDDLNGVKAKVAEHAEKIEAKARQVSMLPANTLSPLEQEKVLAMDPSPPSHGRAEAIEATEEEPREEIPVPTVYPPSTETSGRSEEEQCHEHEPVPSHAEIVQYTSVDGCSMNNDEVLLDQVVDELVRIDEDRAAKVLGVLQERKAAKCKKPPIKADVKRSTSSIGRLKIRRARSKRPRAASRMRKSSAPHHTTKVKMKSKCGVDDDKALMLEGEEISSGRCIPKMAYLKHIAREDLFPPPFIP